MMNGFDVNFDFTTDTPGFWNGFWEGRDGMGIGSSDPDVHSPMLREFHKKLWSRELPNGEMMVLKDDPRGYLRWNGMRFSSDSITASFRYKKCKSLIESVSDTMVNYRHYVEHYIRSSYRIGGTIIFPKHNNSINQRRGTNQYIRDRWDLTLECIKRYYNEEESPLSKYLEDDREFFDLFVNFKGYVDFFFLQDCVSSDYSKVNLWLDTELFVKRPFPRNVDEYLRWIERNLEFVELRNNRIDAHLKKLSRRLHRLIS